MESDFGNDKRRTEGERQEEDGVGSDEVEDEITSDEVESDFGNEERKTEGESLEEDEVRSDEVENHLKNDKRKTKGDLQEEDGDRDGDKMIDKLQRVSHKKKMRQVIWEKTLKMD